MQIFRYQRSKEFNRNEAMYVLHTIDGFSLEDIAKQFNLASDEVKEILDMHKQYEFAITKDLLNEEEK